jgi:hypothetical protein
MANMDKRRRGVTSWLGSGLGEENVGDVAEGGELLTCRR